jgi:polysaccharide deacetylase 2 family uncharacterized protein YibQ
LGVVLTAVSVTSAQELTVPAVPPAYVALIIDDLGNSLRDGRRVVGLPAPIACGVLPHTPFARRLAQEAHGAGKEVLLHLPTESLRRQDAGPGVLEVGMSPAELRLTFLQNLASVPHAVGVSNHMGSRFTQDRPAMTVLMQELGKRADLFFVDSRTSAASVAPRLAAEHRVPLLIRHVFLDTEPTADAVRLQLAELVAIARRQGFALAIGHPHPQTLAAIEQWLATILPEQVKIISLGEMLDRQRDAPPRVMTSN